MIISISLIKTPSQSMRVDLGTVILTLRIFDGGGMMLMDVWHDDIPLVSGVRCTARAPLLPSWLKYRYGQMYFLTRDDALPDWQRFGDEQELLWVP